ncbi:MAG TPA: S9 family peptidase [Terriglobia bacterium]|nr:S9 family peptidase [Terriglobia bacterium]
MIRRVAILCVALVLAGPAVVSGQDPSPLKYDAKAGTTPLRNLTVDDFFGLKDVEDPQLSPESKWVAYTVSIHDLKEDKTKSQVWMVSTSGGEAVPMTEKTASSSHPRWSPDGKYLAFLSARNEGKSQVWMLNRNGGEAQQVTETIQDVDDFEWSPAGDKVVLVLRDPSPEDIAAAKEKEIGIEKPKPKTPAPHVIDRLQFKRDEEGYLDRRRAHLYVLDMATRKMTQVTSGDYDDAEPAWSPDERFLAFASNRTEEPDLNFNSDIWVVAADNPDAGKTLLRLTSNPGADVSPAWSPDGKWVAYVSQIDVKAFDYGTRHLAVVPAAGGKEEILTQTYDRNVIKPRFSSEGQSIYFMAEDDGAQPLSQIPAGGGAVKRILSGRVNVSAFSIGKEGKLAVLLGDPTRPYEVALVENGAPRRLTATNDALLAQIRLGGVEYVHFKSKDGTELAGYLYKPPAYNSELRYPTLLRIHGGPQSQYDSEFNFQAHLFAANGYVVLTPNPRGSTGYGQKFCQAIFADWGNKDYEDVMAEVDYAIAQGVADPARLGVGGWSYGGILTDHVLIRTDRFKAAISGASEFLYIANYGHDHYQREWEYELGPPWKNRAAWEKISPFNSVEKIVTPTLVMGGDTDWNVPVNNSELLYQSLKRLGRTTQLVVYPGEPHGLNKPTHLKDRMERYLAWYGQYVKGETAAAPPPTAK